jgi:hypothetical protein
VDRQAAGSKADEIGEGTARINAQPNSHRAAL